MIQLSHVTKAYGTQQIFENASFTVHLGERVGIVGPNGAGKSTIFEMLTGRLEPDKGEIVIPSGLRIGHVRQQLNPYLNKETLLEYTERAIPELEKIHARITELEHALDSTPAEERPAVLQELGVLQTSFEHLGGYEIRSRAEATLSGLGFAETAFPEPFSRLSGGWQIRAELARNLVAQPDILLLDEPTNYLDVPAVEWLQDFLRSFPGTLLLISHDRYLLNGLTSTTLEVMGTKVTRYPGNYSQYLRERQARYEQLLSAKKNQDRKREQLERFVERFRAKNTKASQAQSRMKALEKMEEIDIPQTFIKPPKIRLPVPPRSGDMVARLENLGFWYSEDRWILHEVDLEVARGERVAVVGLNGMGKTTLLRLIAGRLNPRDGKRLLGHNVEIGYQSQDFADTMTPEKTVFDTVRESAVQCSDGDVRSLLGGFGFPGQAIDKRVSVLSGGEKVRLALARLLLRPVNFLILDEPTTHLDIHAREALEEALAEYQGTICLVSHDVDFVRHVATAIVSVGPDGVRRYYGDYDYYRQKRTEEMAPAGLQPEPMYPQPVETAQDRRLQKREEARLRQEFARQRRPLEQRIARAEALIERLEGERTALLDLLQNPDPSTDFQKESLRLTELQRKLQNVNGEWESASEELESLRNALLGS